MQYLKFQSCKIQLLAILQISGSGKCIAGGIGSGLIQGNIHHGFPVSLMYINRYIKFRQESVNSHNMIEMSVGQKNCLNLQPFTLYMIQQIFRAGSRINDHCLLRILIDYQITIRTDNPRYKFFYLHVFSYIRSASAEKYSNPLP